jgi:anti-anti-sigma factor
VGVTATEQLRIAVEGDPPMIRLIGEVDMANAEEMRAFIEELRRDGSPLVVDLSELRFIDTRGIRALLHVAQAPGGAGPLVLKSPSPTFMKVMKIVGALEIHGVDIVIE